MKKKLFFIFVLSIACFTLLMAQNHDVDTLFNESSNTLTAVPLIINNPALKTGFGAMGMYFFKMDKEDNVSPPSNMNIMGLYSTNHSYFMALMSNLYWSEDKNRANFATGIANINNDFLYNIDDNDVRLVFTENRKFITLEYSRKLLGEFYLGMLYLGTQTSYAFNNGTDEENEFAKDFLKNMTLQTTLYQALD